MNSYQTTKTTLLSIVLSSLCVLASAQTTVAEAQAQAIKKYPALGVQGSPLNLRYSQAVADRRKAKPAFFSDAQWPLLLADELAGNPTPAQPAVPGILPPTQTADVKFGVGRISRWYGSNNGKPTGGLVARVTLSGATLVEAKGIRAILKGATDDAGNELREKADAFGKDDGNFKGLQRPLGSLKDREKNADQFEVQFSFDSPDAARSIKTLAGNIELVVPAKDPGSIVTASFTKDAGKPLKNTVLTDLGVEITLQKPSNKPTGSGTENGVAFQLYDLLYQIKDPKNKVAAVEFFDARGTKLDSAGHGFSDGGEGKTASATFKVMPPPDAIAKIYLVTPRSVITVPFDFKDIPVSAK